MPKMIQIRNVPDSTHRRLKARAASEGLTLSEYLNREVARLAEAPSLTELIERLERLPPVHLSEPIEESVRREREAR